MAVEFRLGDRRPGRREHDHQRCYARDAVVGGAQGDDCGGIVSIVLGGWPILRVPFAKGGIPRPCLPVGTGTPSPLVSERRLVGLGQLRGLSWLTGTRLTCHRSISIVA